MFKNIINGFLLAKNTTDVRNIILLKNILGSLIAKFLIVISSFLSIRLYLDILSINQYSSWLVIMSFLSWFTLFDVGLGNGLRTKLSECVAKEDWVKAKLYISTTFYYVIIISCFIFFCALLLYPIIDWKYFFNVADSQNELSTVIIISIFFTCIQFVLRLVNVILVSLHKNYLSELLYALCQFCTLLVTFIISDHIKHNLIYVAIIFGIVPTCILSFFGLLFFSKNFHLRPDFTIKNSGLLSDITNLSTKFFVIQATALSLFTTHSFLVSHFFSAREVVEYNICFKYFSVVTLIWSIVTSSNVSVIADAYFKKDFDWLKKLLYNLYKLFIGLCLFTFVMLLVSDKIFTLWLGNSIKIPFSLSIILSLYVIQTSWNNIFAYFLNATGILQVIFYISLFILVFNVPISIFLINSVQNPYSIPLSTMIILSVASLLAPYQVIKLLNNRANGVWKQ